MMSCTTFERTVARGVAFGALGISLLLVSPAPSLGQGAATPGASPETAWSCDAMGTPVANNEHSEHGQGMGESDMHDEVEFDQLYIDMMLPHHGSIIALSEAALPHLTDPRLIAMAEDIITNQSTENAQLAEWRSDWYGSSEPATDMGSMEMMLEAMPVTDMEGMMREMDASSQVSTFCAAENPDLAFIEQVIPHHQMAIDTSEIALTEATHPELVAFAEDVIVAQQGEIDQLNAILDEYETDGTPAS